jgi:hypothetical protein
MRLGNWLPSKKPSPANQSRSALSPNQYCSLAFFYLGIWNAKKLHTKLSQIPARSGVPLAVQLLEFINLVRRRKKPHCWLPMRPAFLLPREEIFQFGTGNFLVTPRVKSCMVYCGDREWVIKKPKERWESIVFAESVFAHRFMCIWEPNNWGTQYATFAWAFSVGDVA